MQQESAALLHADKYFSDLFQIERKEYNRSDNFPFHYEPKEWSFLVYDMQTPLPSSKGAIFGFRSKKLRYVLKRMKINFPISVIFGS